ncbi:MAG: NAD-glutamate dehydrogenase [Alphaproteobacteria bacterium]|nr:NAD-glutamate dehydrogenase [Alphaproteobacteria bacterium]
MTPPFSQHLSSLLSTISARLPEVAGKDFSPETDHFLRLYYSGVPQINLEKLDPREACAKALATLDFMSVREPGKPKIRIFTPTASQFGWTSPHTVIEMINDDQPFLVDSVSAELSRLGFSIYAIVHPILAVERDAKGKLLAVHSREAEPDLKQESVIHVEISPLPDEFSAENLEARLRELLTAVHYCVNDWRRMVEKVESSRNTLARAPKEFTPEDVAEAEAFLNWLIDKNLVFLGIVEYDFVDEKGREALKIVPGSEMGLFRWEPFDTQTRGLAALPGEVHHLFRVPGLVEVTKSNQKSPVHRPVPMEYIGVKRFDAKGRVIGETRILGLFTSIVYYQNTETIPLIRRKIARIIKRSGFASVSYDGKALRTILEFFPRDELFQIDEDTLLDTAMGILALEGMPSTRLFVRKDRYERFVSCMVFVPRERFSTDLRMHIQSLLESAYHGELSTYYTQLTESPLARLHVIIKTMPGAVPSPDIGAIEQEIARAATWWGDSLRTQLHAKHGEKQGETLFRRYARAFAPSYTNRYDSLAAVHDISKIEQALKTGSLALDLFEDVDDATGFRLKLYLPKAQPSLSDILPMLENMGLRVIDEYPCFVTPENAEGGVSIRDFRLLPASDIRPALNEIKTLFEDCFARVWSGETESDGFNRLVIRAGFTWREVLVMRAYSRYLKQAGSAFGQDYIEQALTRNPVIARLLNELFHLRFHPDAAWRDNTRLKACLLAIDKALGQVENLDEDRILRRFVDTIQATLRTNYFQIEKGGLPKSWLSFKLDSKKVPDLPLPRPHVEIFVYSTRVEGIHLRGGKVARGGLRWSDRREDYRTEILGLMKAQMVKNAVIVPVGSKGGFVVKHPPREGGRDALMAEGISCYQTYLRGLLDLTDNNVNGQVVPPRDVVRHDGDDPYLVVAADKGTASFSDIANGISAEYGFWLGDAFASGGSVGYDHKAMGITAKGAWISVMRHFREMGRDTQTEDFTVIGIGDMSGDVFGNGMLLSEHIRLIGAFNHLHIFLDPSPDAKKSFAERSRLFHLPRSSWTDYDAKLISKGGGIFERKAKSISLSPEVQAALGVDALSLTPDQLIQAMLKAPVDLLWNGGIGTYVKASTETHADAGDKSNDTTRVNGAELRCKVVGEGGNLGFTQKGRIEYALTSLATRGGGGRINTDAIDNSAGVDCSDHEVNIKIAFGASVSSGALGLEERNRVLESMTDEVATLVLRDNELQTQALSIAESQRATLLDAQARLMRRLAKEGLLSRKIEFLPDDTEISARLAQGIGLTRPELSVILAYSKMDLFQQLLLSSLPDDPYFSGDLLRYFPQAMQERFRGVVESHPLRREIIATVVTNSMVNRVGSTFMNQLAEETGFTSPDIARAYTLARDVFALRSHWSTIEKLDGMLPALRQAQLFAEINRFVAIMTRWFLQHHPELSDLSPLALLYGTGIQVLGKSWQDILPAEAQQTVAARLEALAGEGIPESLAGFVAYLEPLLQSGDIIATAPSAEAIPATARLHFSLGEALQLDYLRSEAGRIPSDAHWSRLAITGLLDSLSQQQAHLTSHILSVYGMDGFSKWLKTHEQALARYSRFLEDLRTSPGFDLAMLSTAVRNLQALFPITK